MSLQPREIRNKRKNNSQVFFRRDKAFGSEAKFREVFPNDDAVLDFIFKARALKTKGHSNFCKCPYTMYHKIHGRLAYGCPCRKSPMVFPLSGTPFEKLKVPLTLIPLVFYEMFSDKNGFAARQIDRRFQDLVKRNETSHLVLERVSQAMGLAVHERDFDPESVIEVDEVFPKVETGFGPYFEFSRGLGSERLQPVIILSERKPAGKSGLTKAFVVDEINIATIANIIKKHVKTTNTIYSDGKNVYKFLGVYPEYKNYVHKSCDHHEKVWVDGDCHVNKVEGCNSYLKNTIEYIHKGIKRHNAQLYAHRVTFNFSFWDKDALSAIDILFKALPGLGEKVSGRVTCLRTKKKLEEKMMKSISKATENKPNNNQNDLDKCAA